MMPENVMLSVENVGSRIKFLKMDKVKTKIIIAQMPV